MSGAATAAFIAPIVGGIAGNAMSQSDRDKAGQLSQRALEVIQGIRVPTPEEQRIILAELKSVGLYTPELEQSINLQTSKMNDIQVDPRLKQAQLSALSKLQEISDNGGMTVLDKTQLSKIQNEVNSNLKGNVDAITQNMATRGMSGGMGEMVSKQLAAQQGANRNAQQGMDVAAQAQQRALSALMQGGQMAGQMQSTDFNQQAQVAQSNDAISKFNTMNQQDVRNQNVQNANAAQQLNLNNQQRISDSNVGLKNQQQMYNKGLEQDFFNNQMQKATSMAGQYNGLSNAANTNAQRTAQMYTGIGAGIGQAASSYDQQRVEDERLAKYGRTK